MDTAAHDTSEFPPDGYRAFRDAGHAVVDLGAGPFPLIVGYDDVRAAARNWSQFTSDTPFEVPIPAEHGVRPVRQLPIETDPPDHTDYRALTARFFSRSAAERHASIVAEVVDAAIDTAVDAAGSLDVVADLALPVVNHGLAATLGRPPEDAERWLEWGIHVFDRGADGKSANRELDGYLERLVDESRASPRDDFFGALARAEFRGRPLTRDEMLGFGNLVFAGGRDTVVAAIASMCWYLAHHPTDWNRLRADVSLAPSTVEEILRLSSPLSFIGRHATGPCRHAGTTLGDGDLVALGFAAANRDPGVFDAPDECRIDRQPNRHIAFGHGPHTCSGANLARMELRVTLERLVARVRELEPAGRARFRRIPIEGTEVAGTIADVHVRLRGG